MALLMILRGNSGSGKTTLARTLQRRFGRNTRVISQDAVRREMLYVRDGSQCEAIPLLCYGREHSGVTILEGILDAACCRPVFECAQALFGQRILAYYDDLPSGETLRRHATKPNRHEFDKGRICAAGGPRGTSRHHPRDPAPPRSPWRTLRRRLFKRLLHAIRTADIPQRPALCPRHGAVPRQFSLPRAA